MGTLAEDLTSIKNVEDTLVANKVARFSYTDTAYTNNDANGVDTYDFNHEQNIPNPTTSVLKVNSTVLDKGYRSQASSITRMLVNHFFGRVSYNLNKINDNMSSLIATLRAHTGTANGFATLDSNGRIPYSQLPESAIELKGYWNASTNTPTLADGTGTNGDEYIVDIAGTQDLGSGSQYFGVGDRVLYTGGVWKNISSGFIRTINGEAPNAQGERSVILGENVIVTKELYDKWLGFRAGQTWSKCTSETSSFMSSLITRVVYHNGLYVANSGDTYYNGHSGFSGIWWSEDGKVWNQGTGLPTTDGVTNIKYIPNLSLWVCGTASPSGEWEQGGDGFYWSEDGKSWTHGHVSDSYYTDRIRPTSFAYNGSIIVAGTEGQGTFWSEDGKTWYRWLTLDNDSSTGMFAFVIHYVYCVNGIFFVCAPNNSGSSCSSVDGKNWITVVTSSNNNDGTPLFGNGTWHFNGYKSTDGVAWTSGGVSAKYGVFANGIFVYSKLNTKGVFWWDTSEHSGTGLPTGTDAPYVEFVTYYNGLFHAYCSTKGIYYSVDGKSWTLCAGLPETARIFASAYCKGVWLALFSDTNFLYKSIDGYTWIQCFYLPNTFGGNRSLMPSRYNGCLNILCTPNDVIYCGTYGTPNNTAGLYRGITARELVESI